MKLLFAGGGTAGHINPALAIAQYIKQHHPEADIRFVITRNGLESRLVPQAGFETFEMDIRGFSRQVSLQGMKYNLSTGTKVLTSMCRASRILKEFRPDLVVGTGGYVSGPILYKAARMGIPTAVHESNAYPGVTVKLLSRYVDRVLMGAEDAMKYIKRKNRCVVVGNPVREEFLYTKKEEARKTLGLDERPLILSYGGSLGAQSINRAVADLMAAHSGQKRCYHIHSAGKNNAQFVQDLLAQKGVDLNENPQIMLREYIDDMGLWFAAADLVICRSGSMTISELEVMGKASILIPYPYAAENHQYYNALALADRGAAELIEDKNLTGEGLTARALALLDDPDQLSEMGKACQGMAILDSLDRIYEVLAGLLSGPVKKKS